MTEERLNMANLLAEKMKFISEVIKKIDEGYTFEIRLKCVRTTDGFSVYPFLSEAQRSEIETLIDKRLRKNFYNYKKEFENL